MNPEGTTPAIHLHLELRCCFVTSNRAAASSLMEIDGKNIVVEDSRKKERESVLARIVLDVYFYKSPVL